METYKAIRAMEKVIEAGEYQRRGYVKCGLRSWMITRLVDASSTYLRRSTDEWSSVRHLNRTIDKDIAEALCYPDALTKEELAEVCAIYGESFSYSWKVEPHFAKLLDHLPGGSEFQPSRDLKWRANIKLRMEQLPTALTITLTKDKTRPHEENGSAHGCQQFAEKLGALGFVQHKDKNGWVQETTYYFARDNEDDFVFTKMKYS
jgi:hypothetical protein